MSNIKSATNDTEITEKGFFGKLSNGDLGLAKTFWVYGSLVGIVVSIVLKFINESNSLLFIAITLAHITYLIPLIMGIWRAASKYKGSKVWAILAKISCIFNVIILVSIIMILIVGLLNHLPAQSQQSSSLNANSASNAVSSVITRSSEPSLQQIEEKLFESFTNSAQQINKKGVTIIDKDTRLDGASAGPGPRLTYHYTLLNYTSRDISPNSLQGIQPEVQKSVCTNEGMKPSLEYGGIYVYAYSGNDGVEITRFEINKSDCTKSISAQTHPATESVNIAPEKQKSTNLPIVTQTNDSISVVMGKDKFAVIKGSRRTIGQEMNQSRLSSPNSNTYGR